MCSLHPKKSILRSKVWFFTVWDRFDRGNNYGQDRGRSRSPKGPAWGDRNKGLNRERSRSRERSPPRSFHQAMMERSRPSSPPQHQRGPPYNSENARERKDSPQGWGRSSGSGKDDRGLANGSHSSYFGEEEEEGMIPQDDDDMYRAANEDAHRSPWTIIVWGVL